eukprot:5505785-Prymnesium_polylepis.1
MRFAARIARSCIPRCACSQQCPRGPRRPSMPLRKTEYATCPQEPGRLAGPGDAGSGTWERRAALPLGRPGHRARAARRPSATPVAVHAGTAPIRITEVPHFVWYKVLL